MFDWIPETYYGFQLPNSLHCIVNQIHLHDNNRHEMLTTYKHLTTLLFGVHLRVFKYFGRVNA